MPKRKREPKESKLAHDHFSLSLKLETTDRNNPNVDVDDFFNTAEKWLRALKTFAKEQGQHVKWEIVDLKKASALIQVQPVKVTTGRPALALVKKWEEGLRKIEKTGKPAPKFTPEALSALREFVFSVPANTRVSIGTGAAAERHPITATTQRRVEQAASQFPAQSTGEYVSQGSVRGRLAVLDSWNPDDRSFRLQLPLAPNKPVRCTYRDSSLSTELGEGFDGMVEITGQLRYKPGQPWPYAADVEHVRVLPRKPKVSLKDLVGLVTLPEGQDSTAYVRGLRDAE
ncbi:MAG TPA: hypothetical protein VOA41_17795 [Candidatus Dormibacteraeota bacterium]|nr:hypothetical protein [Candidatus Dormibacteraeota bacterium]